ncbi:hypothetical protein EBZ39_03785 [bacterium]|nr:hypothetical protein [bacterium]
MQPEIFGDDLVAPKNALARSSYFISNVYTIQLPELLPLVSEIAEELLKAVKEKTTLNEIYPVVMTDNLYTDVRAEPFLSYVGGTGWNILNSEGYDMDRFNLRFSEAWVQEHHKHSLMETHVHGGGAQLSGFYFLEAPENCSRVVIHDPRPGKVQINLPQKDMDMATDSSEMINFKPEPGLLMFVPSWLPHSFGRHASDSPLKFVHFNLFAEHKQVGPQVCGVSQAEVI